MYNRKELPSCGTMYKMAISRDPEQKYLYVSDTANSSVWIVDRQSGKTLGAFGGNGHIVGQLHWVNAIASDSLGNIYTGEVELQRRELPVLDAAHAVIEYFQGPAHLHAHQVRADALKRCLRQRPHGRSPPARAWPMRS